MRKKCADLALGYAIAGLAAGVFFREFTKLRGYRGTTVLSAAHPHLLVLGTFLFLLAMLCAHSGLLRESRRARAFFLLYNIGVPLTALMLMIRGVLQVLGTPLSAGADAAISGAAGIGHLLTGAGLILLLLCLRSGAPRRPECRAPEAEEASVSLPRR